MSTNESAASETPGEGTLVRLVRSLGFADATAHDDLLELGLSSLQILQLSADIEREYGTAVDLSVLLAASTIGGLQKDLDDGRHTG